MRAIVNNAQSNLSAGDDSKQRVILSVVARSVLGIDSLGAIGFSLTSTWAGKQSKAEAEANQTKTKQNKTKQCALGPPKALDERVVIAHLMAPNYFKLVGIPILGCILRACLDGWLCSRLAGRKVAS